MKIKLKGWGFWLSAMILGSLWAYGLSTRIDLLFISPLWLKAIILLGLGANFTFLAAYFINKFLNWSANKKVKLILVALAVLLSAAIFVLAPYHSVPFRTTHTLTLTPTGPESKLVEILSPDGNLIDRSEFDSSGDVLPFDVSGFRLLSGGTLSYQRGLTGGLTLIFTGDSSPLQITWDGQSQSIDPAQALSGSVQLGRGWETEFNANTNRIAVTVPGYTWGQPDHLWMILGGLLPVADFTCLASLILLAGWGLIGWAKKSIQIKPDPRWAGGWLQAMACFGLATLLIKINYDAFMPRWFLALFIPAMIFLLYHQVEVFAKFDPAFSFNAKLQKALHKVRTGLLKVNQSKWLFWVLILLIATLAVYAHLSLTEEGMGISGDSVHYMNSTQNLAEGNGYVRTISEGDPIVMTGFPPVYPLSLLPGVWTGIGIETFARYQNALLLFLTLVISAWLVYRSTGKVLPAVWVTAMIAMAPPILSIYAWVMSEPLFILLFLLELLLLIRLFTQPKTWLVLLIGLIAGIATLTRLAGITFIPVFALGVLLFQKTEFRKRLSNAFLLGFSALLPVAAFFIRNKLVATQVSESRGFTIAKFTREYWEILGKELISWFKWKEYFNQSYQRFNALFITLGIIFLLILFWLIFRKKLSKTAELDPIIIVLLISIPAYLALIVLNTIFLTPQQTIPGLSRYMLPYVIILFIALGKILHDYWQASPFLARIALLFVLVQAFSFYMQDTIDFVEKPNDFLLQYTNLKNDCGTDMETFLQTLPDAEFTTNNCEYFYFVTGIPCNYLSMEDTDYLPDGTVNQILQSGTILAYAPGFGNQSESLTNLIPTLQPVDTVCHLEFYIWAE